MFSMLRDVLQHWAGGRLNQEFEGDRNAASARWNRQPKLSREDVMNSPFAVAIFTAAWDRGSKHYAPVVDQVSERFGHSAAVGFVDVDVEHSLVQQVGLATVPAVGFFRGGEVIVVHIGFQLDVERMTERLIAGHETIPACFKRPARRGVSTC